MINYFYSDPHYGHARIIRLCNRPFADALEMQEALITRYNARVKESDTVLWTGDAFFAKTAVAKDIMSRLNGNKILIRGNHDRGTGVCLAMGFDLVYDGSVCLSIDGHAVRCSHYPYLRQDADQRYADRRPVKRDNEFLVHGHTHSTKKKDGNMIHVGVDAWDYYPVSTEEVLGLIND